MFSGFKSVKGFQKVFRVFKFEFFSRFKFRMRNNKSLSALVEFPPLHIDSSSHWKKKNFGVCVCVRVCLIRRERENKKVFLTFQTIGLGRNSFIRHTRTHTHTPSQNMRGCRRVGGRDLKSNKQRYKRNLTYLYKNG